MRDTRPKAGSVLGVEEPGESELNQRIKLPRALELFMRSSLEVPVVDFQVLVGQMETVVGLTTLFPNEAEYFRQKVDMNAVLAKLPDLNREPSKAITLRGLSLVAQLAPEKLPTFPPELGTLELSFLQKKQYKPHKIERAARLALIFPDRKTEILQAVQTALHEYGSSDRQEFWEAEHETGLWLMRDLLLLNPSFHPKLHTLASQHQVELEKLFEIIEEGGNLSGASNLAVWYSVKKLLLAEEITVSPTGILLAVEKPVLHRARPLPDRQLAV